ncbi:MAG: hypothetical protein IPP94_14965 [Ignavibacteria bacterium]|nr:hypothetical protein [Ignavibacteria bacterium]
MNHDNSKQPPRTNYRLDSYSGSQNLQSASSTSFVMMHILIAASMLFPVVTATAQWLPCGISVAVPDTMDKDLHALPSIEADGQGGVFVCWQQHSTTDIFIAAQRISSDGRYLWSQSGQQVSFGDGVRTQAYAEMIADPHDGGVFIAWEYGSDLRVQKLDTSGRLLWPDNGTLASSISCYGITMAVDSLGGVFVGSIGNDTAGNFTPWLQHIDSDGKRLWGDEGNRLTNRNNKVRFRNVRVVSGPQPGTAMVFWAEGSASNNEDQTWAQLFSGDGHYRWIQYGIPLSMTPSGQRDKLWAISDGRGGAFVSWSARSVHNEIVQHIDSTGALPLGQDGYFFCDGFGKYDMISDGRGGAIIAANCWGPYGTVPNYYMQRITADNRVVWGDSIGTLILSPGAYRDTGHNMIVDGKGGVWFANGGKGLQSIYIQRIDSNRIPIYGPDGLLVCQIPSGQRSYFDIAATAPGELMLSWMDFRSGTANSYVAKITTGGVVGIREIAVPLAGALTLSEIYPHPAMAESVISCTLREQGQVRLALCDINGSELRVLADGERQPGTFIVPVDNEGLPDGTYFITASVGVDVKVKKMLVIKR